MLIMLEDYADSILVFITKQEALLCCTFSNEHYDRLSFYWVEMLEILYLTL